MQTAQVILTDEMKVELQTRELNESLGPHDLLVQTEYSVISAGTEGANFSGLEREHPAAHGFGYPRTTGYGNLGRVLKAGSARKELVGKRVLSFANHARTVKVNAAHFVLPVPDEADGKEVVFARMAGVAITSVRSSSVSIGDTVAVVGLGLVGNFAAQLFQIAGADVLGVDLSAFRVGKARDCGIRRTCDASTETLADVVHEWTHGAGFRIGVEAIGNPQAIEQTVRLTAKHGEVILLGSPRKRVTMDVTPMLSHIHVQGVRMIGALEWLYPIQPHAGAGRVILRNYHQIVHWIMDGTLTVSPLRTHVLSPADCQEAYTGLQTKKDEYLGVVFDWARLD